jgi:oxaloacetate decarboxylase alpha subunit
LLEPRLEKMREEIKDLAQSEEDVLSYALFPQVARKFFEARAGGVPAAEPPAPAAAAGKNGARAGRAPKGKEAGRMNLEEIRELIRLLNETDVTEFALESQGVKISIKKGQAGGGPASEGSLAPQPPEAVRAAAPAGRPEQPQPPAPEENLVTVVAPMVGTFYRAPAPDAPPYVEIGDSVHEGQVLCIIEAMKLMNEIEAEAAGEIVDILVENGQPVEYGQPLFLIRPAQG